MSTRRSSRGQVLVLFVLFLLVLLGISALAIDYAGWLLTDRSLQNVTDHAALAGASQFQQRQTQGSCSGGTGQQQCNNARIQMWTSLNEELSLGLSATTISCLASASPGFDGNSPAAGDTDSARCTSEPVVQFKDRIWVATPPPTYAAYTAPFIGGRYAQNFSITFARVDRNVRSFIGGALGIQPQPRHGWATAGALPIGFALQTFCRNSIAPESGACVNSAGVTIDGQGGIRLVRGDIGSNESLKVSATGGQGVQLYEGNMFLVNGVCGSSSWRCPNGPPSVGGISDGAPSYIGENAFYMAPWVVPQYASPLDGAGISAWDCSGASSSNLCVPYKNQGGTSTAEPGDWTCLTTGSVNRCGAPTVTSGSVTCVGQGGGNPPLHYYPISVSAGANTLSGDPAHPQSNGNEYQNLDDSFENLDLDTTAPPGTPANPPTDYAYIDNIRLSGPSPWTRSFTVNLAQSGPRLPGISTVRYVAFKTNSASTPAGAIVGDGNNVTLQVSLLGSAGTILADPTIRTLNNVPTRYEFTVGAGVIPAAQFNSLRLQFTFTSTAGTPVAERGGGVSWAEIQHPDPEPALTPMIPPGYYRSIVLPDNTCAILDPTAEYSSLRRWQMPGIYRFGGSGPSNNKKIKVGDGSFLIGDGVTLVFDQDWPASGSNQGVAIGANGALVLNTMRVAGSPPCTDPAFPETTNTNESVPLSALPYSSVCAAWAIDPTVLLGIRPGQSAWHACDDANPDNPSQCVSRASYNPVSGYRGVTFYFTPDGNWTKAHANITIQNRFEMQGGSTGNEAGIAFRGVMYAPYDDVKITGANGFSTVGQVLAWTAKFNGGGSFIDLDFPYEPTTAAPYLLEPTIDH
jgi:Flp pilus assembly protein TadG